MKLSKFFSKSFSTLSHTFTEVKLPTPWGFICGKWWGDQTIHPLLAIHDYRQNASAFDKLIPHLQEPSVLAIDLPGHGQSSPFPLGRYPTHIDFFLALRCVTKNLPDGQYRFLGHGLGSSVAFVFAASYFKNTETLISLECTRHVISEFSGLNKTSDRFFEIEQTPEKPMIEENILKIIKKCGPMSEEAANILLQRSLKKKNGQTYFSNDPRYELPILQPILDNDIANIASILRCNTLIVRNTIEDSLPPLNEKGKGSFSYQSNHQMIRRKGCSVVKKWNDESVERLKKGCHYLEYKEICEPKHILLDSPELLAKLINQFSVTNLEGHKIYLDSLDHLVPQSKT